MIASGCFAWTPDSWTTQDTILQSAFAVVMIGDWAQTRFITYSPNYHDTNIFLGENASYKKINIYFASCFILHTGIAYILPQNYRTIWQTIWITIEGNQIYQNYSIGCKMRF